MVKPKCTMRTRMPVALSSYTELLVTGLFQNVPMGVEIRYRSGAF